LKEFILPENIDPVWLLKNLRPQYKFEITKATAEAFPLRRQGRRAKQWKLQTAGPDAQLALAALENWLDAQGVF
jgi:hypothetical protein